MSSFVLKVIASIAMLIDHVAVVFLPYGSTMYTIGRAVGRVAFPIYCFLLVEGFFHTSNLRKYMIRLGIFALISEVVFDYALIPKALWNSHQNVFFTLLIGLIVISFYDYIVKRYQAQSVMMNTFAVITILVGCFLAIAMKCDYSYLGILFILGFYIYHNQKKKMAICFVLLVGFLCGGVQFFCILALPFLWFYNQKQGPKVKYAFYAFYPLHLFVIGLISHLIAG